MYDRVGGRLYINHPVAMVYAEKRMCNCRTDKPSYWIKGSYPACIFKAFKELPLKVIEDTLIQSFWECLVNDVKKKHPEWVMEAFMVN